MEGCYFLERKRVQWSGLGVKRKSRLLLAPASVPTFWSHERMGVQMEGMSKEDLNGGWICKNIVDLHIMSS